MYYNDKNTGSYARFRPRLHERETSPFDVFQVNGDYR